MGQDDISLVSTTDSAEEVAAALTGKPVETTPAEPVTPAAADAAPAAAAEIPAVADPEPAKPVVAEPVSGTETAEQKAERAAGSSRERRMAKIQKDIDTLWAQRGNARRDVEAEEARLNELRRQREGLEAEIALAKAQPATGTPTTAAAFTTAKPKLDDVDANGQPKYASYEDWVDDLGQWHALKSHAESVTSVAAVEARLKKEHTDADRARIEHETVTRANQDAATKYRETLSAFKTRTPDFDAVLANAKDSVQDVFDDLGPNALSVIDRYTVHDADNGPAIVHFLAQNPDELRRIAGLPLPLQLAALGKLDNRLQPASTHPARATKAPVRNAPEPMKPVGSTPTASSVSPDDEPYPVYRARRDREERDARGLVTR